MYLSADRENQFIRQYKKGGNLIECALIEFKGTALYKLCYFKLSEVSSMTRGPWTGINHCVIANYVMYIAINSSTITKA